MTGSQAAGCRAGVAQDRVGPQHPLQERKQTANNLSDKLDLREPDWLPRTSTVVDSTVHSGHCLLSTLDQKPWNDLMVHSIGQRSHTGRLRPRSKSHFIWTKTYCISCSIHLWWLFSFRQNFYSNQCSFYGTDQWSANDCSSHCQCVWYAQRETTRGGIWEWQKVLKLFSCWDVLRPFLIGNQRGCKMKPLISTCTFWHLSVLHLWLQSISAVELLLLHHFTEFAISNQ